jgi:hypothetical protein
MYAVVRDNRYDMSKLARSSTQMKEFQERHAAQPGYEGNIVVDLGDGHMVILTLWRTEEEANAARAALEPEIERLLVPLMAAPSHLIGNGPVVVNDISKD